MLYTIRDKLITSIPWINFRLRSFDLGYWGSMKKGRQSADALLTPSPEDLKLTKKIKAGCEILEITLLDHIIVTSESY